MHLVTSIMKQTCNLCGQVLSERLQKIKHEEWHAASKKLSNENRIVGTVEWI